MDKIRPSFKKLLLYAIVSLVVVETILFISFFSYFATFPWQAFTYAIVILPPVLIFILFIFSTRQYYYVIDKKNFMMKKFNKEFYFDYDNIIYIDQNRKNKNKAIAFFTPKSGVHYLTPDKDDILYQTLLKKCQNLISEQDFKIRFPNVKI